MLPQARTKQLLISTAILCLCLVVGAVFFYSKIHDKAEDVAVLQRELALDLETGSQRAALTRLVNETADQRAQLDSLFVSSRGVAPFIQRIESVASDAQAALEITNVSLSEDDVEDGGEPADIETVELVLSANGSWAQVIHFVQLLEAMPLHLELEDVSVSRISNRAAPQATTSLPTWGANITLQAYKLTTESVGSINTDSAVNDDAPTTMAKQATSTDEPVQSTTTDTAGPAPASATSSQSDSNLERQ